MFHICGTLVTEDSSSSYKTCDHFSGTSLPVVDSMMVQGQVWFQSGTVHLGNLQGVTFYWNTRHRRQNCFLQYVPATSVPVQYDG